MDAVLYQLRAISRDVKHLSSQIQGVTRKVSDISKSLPDSSNVKDKIAQIRTAVGDIAAMQQANFQAHPFMYDWMLVMMVTFAEAYLQNVLVLLETSYPAWMGTKEKLVSGRDVLKSEGLDPEKQWRALMTIIRQRWAEHFLRNPPTQWIARLEKFGATGYQAGLGEQMATIWNRRHAIVHSVEVIQTQSDDLLRSGPSRFHQSQRFFEEALAVIWHFVQVTDAFVVHALATHASGHPSEAMPPPKPA
jgi:hypothetical protein